MSPQRSDLVLTSHVPNGEAAVFILHCLNIEAWKQATIRLRVIMWSLSNVLENRMTFSYSYGGDKGRLTTRFDPPPNGLRELKLHRSSTNVCTKTKMFLKIFFDIRFRSEGA